MEEVVAQGNTLTLWSMAIYQQLLRSLSAVVHTLRCRAPCQSKLLRVSPVLGAGAVQHACALWGLS